MSWIQPWGEEAFTSKGEPMPTTPNEVYCFELGVAVGSGILRPAMAISLMTTGGYTPAERDFARVGQRIQQNT